LRFTGGSGRAWPLSTLRSLAASGLAAPGELGVTLSVVSQHLNVLHRNGLVGRQRTGRAALLCI